ncbi:hypothetical protein RRG08_012661 [Elysia crispata]|uniref:Uncharacterized protein n=1 Tax=Elysia crispata TaxID=231223 RepID=A0AAE0YN64_9GAST|nr:hypothetical protein RRG08_012661 [Elysia crispata]
MIKERVSRDYNSHAHDPARETAAQIDTTYLWTKYFRVGSHQETVSRLFSFTISLSGPGSGRVQCPQEQTSNSGKQKHRHGKGLSALSSSTIPFLVVLTFRDLWACSGRETPHASDQGKQTVDAVTATRRPSTDHHSDHLRRVDVNTAHSSPYTSSSSGFIIRANKMSEAVLPPLAAPPYTHAPRAATRSQFEERGTVSALKAISRLFARWQEDS